MQDTADRIYQLSSVLEKNYLKEKFDVAVINGSLSIVTGILLYEVLRRKENDDISWEQNLNTTINKSIKIDFVLVYEYNLFKKV